MNVTGWLRRTAAAMAVVMMASSCAVMTRVSLGDSGQEPIGASEGAAVSSDGRYTVFESDADNLVPGDTNGQRDVFRRDNRDGTTRLVSRDWRGQIANGPSDQADVSADGRWVAFRSAATDIVQGDTNGVDDVFLRDMDAGTTILVSARGGTLGDADSSTPSVDDGGRWVVFTTEATNLDTAVADNNGHSDVYLLEVLGGALQRVSYDTSGRDANGDSRAAVISADASTVVFESLASDLVAGDTNNRVDVFRWTGGGGTTLVSVDSGGGPTNGTSRRPDVSGDGRWVAFESLASDVVAGDSNGRADVFRRNTQTGTTERVSEDASGGNANHGSYAASISADGQRVAFESDATDLVGGGDTNGLRDVFVWGGARTELIPIDLVGGQGNGASGGADLSDDGRVVAFTTDATNLRGDDTNGVSDVLARPAVIPRIDSVGIDHLPVGVTTSFVVLGENFGTGTRASVAGDGITATSTTFLSTFAVEVEVTVDGAAAPGERQLWIYDTAPTLGWPTIGAGDRVFLDVPEFQPVSFSDSIVPDPDADAWEPAMSSDGRYVAFVSDHPYDPGDTNDDIDIYRRDMATGAIELVTVDGAGAGLFYGGEYPSISGDGRYVAFSTVSDIPGAGTNVNRKIALKDMVTGSLVQVSPVANCFDNESSLHPLISRDGSSVVYGYRAGCDGQTDWDLFRWGRITGAVTQVGGSIGNEFAYAVNADGRYVVARGVAPSNTVWVVDTAVPYLDPGWAEQVDVTSTGGSGGGIDGNAWINDDGTLVAFETRGGLVPSDVNSGAIIDVYVRDLAADTTTLISRTAGGSGGNANSLLGAISGDGEYLVFRTQASDLDTAAGARLLRAEADGGPIVPIHPTATANAVHLGADGRCATLLTSSDLGFPPAGGNDVFRWDAGSCVG